MFVYLYIFVVEEDVEDDGWRRWSQINNNKISPRIIRRINSSGNT